MFDATPLLRFHARRRRRTLARQDPVAAQRLQLANLLTTARDTRFGRDHGFNRITDIEGFQKAVPLRRQEDLWAAYWQGDFPVLENVSWPGRIPYFAVTSGTTTGRTKYIPCPMAMVASNKRAALDVLVHHIAARPNSRLFAGRSFMLGGSTALKQEAPGVFSGDLSGIAVATMPWWARLRYFPPPKLALLSDWEEKIAHLGPLSLKADIRAISGVPSWLLVFFDRLHAMAPNPSGRLADYYPDLELVIHGGVNFAPYRPRFDELLDGMDVDVRETYAASEGFIAVADRDYGDGMRLISDHGIFYEFVPADELDSATPTRHHLGTVEAGVNYAIVLSSCAGIWACPIGDTVRFVDLDPPRLLVTGRTAQSLSAFGEHVIVEELEEAVAAAAAAIDAEATDFSVAARVPEQQGTLGRHLFVIEFVEAVDGAARLARFAEVVDTELSKTNEDYEAHRAGGVGLDGPQAVAVAPGTFAAWMKTRGRLGGQNKVPRVIADRALFENLLAFAEDGRVTARTGTTAA